jgi:hypothetical protein
MKQQGGSSMTEAWRYEIRVAGRLGERWAHWFEDMDVTIQPDTTTLTGAVLDQAALLGVLQKLYTLGLPLLLVRREEIAATQRVRREA